MSLIRYGGEGRHVSIPGQPVVGIYCRLLGNLLMSFGDLSQVNSLPFMKQKAKGKYNKPTGRGNGQKEATADSACSEDPDKNSMHVLPRAAVGVEGAIHTSLLLVFLIDPGSDHLPLRPASSVLDTVRALSSWSPTK